MTQSLWTIPSAANVVTPLSMLREQASALTSETGGKLNGWVNILASGDNAIYQLLIQVPMLNGYTYEVCRYQQPMQTLYPGYFQPMSGFQSEEISNEFAMKSALHMRLSSPQMIQVIQNLLVQVN